MRFKIARPIEGGSAYWDITDTKLDLTVVTIHKSVREAWRKAEVLCNELNRMDQAQ